MQHRHRHEGAAEVAGIVDPVWTRLRQEAEAVLQAEPALATIVLSTVLNQDSLEAAVAHRVASRLAHSALPFELIIQSFAEYVDADRSSGEAFRADILATVDRDPAATRLIEPVLYFKG